MNKKIVVANWKMNPATLREAKSLYVAIKTHSNKMRHVETIICPPSLYLTELKKIGTGKRLLLGAQDAFWKDEGSYTGEVSAKMIRSAGASHVILGHSEQRSLGESDNDVNKKLLSTTKNGLVAVVCIGENERDKQGEYLRLLRYQLNSSLKGLPLEFLSKLVIAYEPVWAIGKDFSRAMSSHELHGMTIYIKKIMTSMYEKKVAFAVPILYGGSVSSDNTSDLIKNGEVQGLLVGRESLKSNNFANIIEKVNQA
jgi:triosephosphate isomerase (TIM)